MEKDNKNTPTPATQEQGGVYHVDKDGESKLKERTKDDSEVTS